MCDLCGLVYGGVDSLCLRVWWFLGLYGGGSIAGVLQLSVGQGWGLVVLLIGGSECEGSRPDKGCGALGSGAGWFWCRRCFLVVACSGRLRCVCALSRVVSAVRVGLTCGGRRLVVLVR